MRYPIKTGLILFSSLILALLIWRHQHPQIIATQAKDLSQSPQETSQTETQAARLAAQSAQMLDETYDNLVLSVLLATESMRRLPTVEGNIALRRSMSLLLRPITYMDPETDIRIGAFTPNLDQLATGGGTVQIWDMATGQATIEIHHEGKPIRAIEFSPDAHQLATSGEDKTVRIWNPVTGQEIVRINFDSSVGAISFSSDGKWLAIGSHDGTASIWDIATQQEVVQFLQDEYVSAVALSPDGKWLATGSGDGTARIWDIATNNEMKRFVHSGAVQFVEFTSDGKLLITSNANKINVWDTTSGTIMTVIKESGVDKVALSPDGHRIATGNYDGLFRVWETATGKEIGRTVHPSWRGFSSIALAFSADNQQLGTSAFSGPASTWQIEPLPEVLLQDGDDVAINEVMFSPDDQWLATKREDNAVQLWAISSTQEITRIQHQSQINDLTFSPSGNWLATASTDNTAQILSITRPSESVLLPHNGPVNQVAFSPNNRQVATASDDGTARIWEVNTGKEVLRLGHGTFVDRDGVEQSWPINTVTFSPDGQQLATGSNDSTARIWDVETGKEYIRFEHER